MMPRSFDEIKEALLKGEVTLPALVENYLEQIEKNKFLNMYVEVWGEEAITRAKQLQ
jgi:Asp-tRNA(Asn)/Glu-tRNA(Gln) amidotransferase A subunit family amidase